MKIDVGTASRSGGKKGGDGREGRRWGCGTCRGSSAQQLMRQKAPTAASYLPMASSTARALVTQRCTNSP